MTDLSIIVPFVNEWPMLPYTVRSIFEELEESGIDFEVIVVNNYCQEVEEQHEAEMRSYTAQLLDANIVDITHLDREYFNSIMINFLTGRRLESELKAKLEVAKGNGPSKELEGLKKTIERKTNEHRWSEDRAGDQLAGLVRMYPWLKYLEYTDKLSHWQAKNLGVQSSKGKFLLFMDAHCAVRRDSLIKMYDYYLHHSEELDGTLHLPLSYHIGEARKLIYKLVADPAKGWYHYSFTPYRDNDIEPGKPYEVPCMSTCGMMMTRELYDLLGGWPTELGIVQGGEDFINFGLAVLGKHKYIMPGKQLCHHGAPRGYHGLYDDNKRNIIIAHYMFGGVDVARLLTQNTGGNPKVLFKIFNGIVDNEACIKHRALIKSRQVATINEWLAKWR